MSIVEKLSDCYNISDFEAAHDAELKQFNIYFALIFVVSAMCIIFWVYWSLRINIKVYRVLIWFLEIPFDYIHFA